MNRSYATRPVLLLVLCLLIVSGLACYPTIPPEPVRPAPTAEPLVPTPLPTSQATRSSGANAARPTLAPTPRPAPANPLVSSDEQPKGQFPFGGPARDRVGVGFPLGRIKDYDWGQGLPGWWLSWRVDADAAGLSTAHFAQMVRVRGDGFRPELAVIEQTARAHPGALWLLGNEPDVLWQDNATPEEYAAHYGILYPAIKAADPTALVAIAGVSQPTPLRMAYLDRILAAYQAQFGAAMPVDVWNVHAFILREERDSWGVGIPPGMEVDAGILYEIGDHADMAIFRQQIVDFRRWMAERGFRDAPLVVSEYGVLMPDSYGFPAERVAGFLIDTFDFFLTASDPEIGYPPDENRLVQAFCWYSVADTVYPTPNLFDPESGALTPVGETFIAYVAGLP